MSTRDEIIASFTRTLFVDAYASFVERAQEDREPIDDLPRAGAGEDWMDHAPETPLWTESEAQTAIDRIESMGRTVERLYELASESCARDARSCVRKRHNPEQFGHYLAMQYVGHGVAWDDDHAMRLHLPHGEGPFVGCRADAGLPEREE
jgi:hypothetical protein